MTKTTGVLIALKTKNSVGESKNQQNMDTPKEPIFALFGPIFEYASHAHTCVQDLMYNFSP